MKPDKIIYDNQNEILSKILEVLRKELNSEAYIFGSLARKEFGKYVEKYDGHDGSDIDVVFFGDKGKWKYLNVSKGWWDLYRGPKIEINGTIHKVDLVIVKKGCEQKAREKIKEWKVIKI